MKNKKQILKICALICIGSIACIIPACVVSCGSSTSSPSSSINSNNSSTTNNSLNQRTSNDDFIDANVNQNATQVL
ncbi:hypothetical protein J6P59_00380 [bacterium]|nr:hypothetical protein [bacterium]